MPRRHDTDNVTDADADQEPGTGLAPVQQGGGELVTVEGFAAMTQILDSIPTVEDDPTEKMIMLILAAENPVEYEKIFHAAHFKESVGKEITVHDIRVADSEFKGGTGKYLLCDVTLRDTGEKTVMTCGSDMAMAILLNHWRRGDLPYDFEVVIKDRATKNGFFPMRLKPLGKPMGVAQEPS